MPSVHLFSSERGPGAGAVRARLPAKPMNSVFEREPWTGKSGKRGPGAGAVRARLPAKPMNSVFEREPWTGKSGKRGSGAGAVRAHLPTKPMNSVFEREPWTGTADRPTPPARQRLITSAEPWAVRGDCHWQKVKFKLTIQSENLRLNSKCFYHYKTD